LVASKNKARFGGLFFVLLLALQGCALRIAPEADPRASAPSVEGHVLVFGRINYVVDGEPKAPYGAFKPQWPAPFLSALHLETGDAVQSHAVRNEDGSFAWEFPPGHYVISRIGVGQYMDDTYIAWPRIAFHVPAGARRVYLGHLVLDGASYAEPYALSTGTKGVSRGVRYRFRIEDEALAQADRSLFFHDPAMPIGEPLVDQWRADRGALIRKIFR
jgi:hypothetical protein